MDLIQQNLPLIASLAASTVVGLILVGLYQYFSTRAQSQKMHEKIRQDSAPVAIEGKKDEEKLFMKLFQSLGKGMAPKKPEEYTRMRVRFYKAGINYQKAPLIFLGTKLFLMISLVVAFLATRIMLLDILVAQLTMLLCFIFAAIGFYLPDIWLRVRSSKRQRLIFEGFPDALDLLVVCVESGMGMDGAIARVGTEMKLSNQMISDEFRMLNLEIRAGKSREEAFKNLALRTDIEDVKNLINVLIQTDKFGTSVGQALRVFSDTFRTKRYQIAEEIAAKLPVKLVFPLVLFIFPSLFVVVAGPAAIRIYNTLINPM